MDKKLEKKLVALMAKYGLAKDGGTTRLSGLSDLMKQTWHLCSWKKIVGTEIVRRPLPDGSLGYVPNLRFRDDVVIGQPDSSPLATMEEAEHTLALLLHVVRFKYPKAKKIHRPNPHLVQFRLFDFDIFIPRFLVEGAQAATAAGHLVPDGIDEDEWAALSPTARVWHAGKEAAEQLAAVCPFGMDDARWDALSAAERDVIRKLATHMAAAGRYVLREHDPHWQSLHGVPEGVRPN